MDPKLAILASGTGSNARAIIEKAKQGILRARVALVFSNVPDAPVLERAREAGVHAEALDNRLCPDRRAYDRRVADIVRAAGCQFVILAGYMRLLSAEFLAHWPQATLNIHPALLPSFPGVHGARDALNYGVRISGPSVHFVDEEMDNGALIIQAAVPVLQNDTAESLQMRIHSLEHRIYPQAIQWLVTGRLSVEGRRVMLAPGEMALAQAPEGALVWPPLEEGF